MLVWNMSKICLVKNTLKQSLTRMKLEFILNQFDWSKDKKKELWEYPVNNPFGFVNAADSSKNAEIFGQEAEVLFTG